MKNPPINETVDNAMHIASDCLVRQDPDMALVQPCDTDPETYADIQNTLACANWDGKAAYRWRTELHRLRPPPESIEELGQNMRQISDDRTRRLSKAIRNARRRLGRKPQT